MAGTIARCTKARRWEIGPREPEGPRLPRLLPSTTATRRATAHVAGHALHLALRHYLPPPRFEVPRFGDPDERRFLILADHPELAEFLVRCGIDSMSVSPDSFIAVKEHVAAAETNKALRRA